MSDKDKAEDSTAGGAPEEFRQRTRCTVDAIRDRLRAGRGRGLGRGMGGMGRGRDAGGRGGPWANLVGNIYRFIR